MKLGAKRAANQAFLEARDAHTEALVERDAAERAYDEAVERLRSRTIYLARIAAERDRAFPALPTDLQELYRD